MLIYFLFCQKRANQAHINSLLLKIGNEIAVLEFCSNRNIQKPTILTKGSLLRRSDTVTRLSCSGVVSGHRREKLLFSER
jgi:hypothetical protein